MGHNPRDTAATLRALRGIVEHRQHGQVQGTQVDLYTASTIVQVHDALSPENQQRLLLMSPARMAEVAFAAIALAEKRASK